MAASVRSTVCIILVIRIKRFSCEFLIKLGIGMPINFDHNRIRTAIISGLPVIAIGNAAFDLRSHVLSPPVEVSLEAGGSMQNEIPLRSVANENPQKKKKSPYKMGTFHQTQHALVFSRMALT